jgi:hypothetical protein
MFLPFHKEVIAVTALGCLRQLPTGPLYLAVSGLVTSGNVAAHFSAIPESAGICERPAAHFRG